MTNIYNPCMPYWGAIPGGVCPGLIIHIKGYVPKDTDEFAINLMQGHTAPTSNTNIALHVNPRVRDQYIVLNSRNQNGWGVEESYNGQLITSGNTFILDICVESNLYNIYVNGVHIKSFHHRLTYQDVGVLWIEKGIVDIQHIEYRNQTVSAPIVYTPAPCIPYWGVIPGGVRPGLVILIEGYVPKDSVEFAINLMQGHTAPTSSTNIALHVNPRVRDDYIVINSRNQNGWGVEESYSGQLITRGSAFTLEIYVENDLYRIYANRVLVKNFHHRLAYQDVGVLWIEKGIVDIKRIEYKDQRVSAPPVYTFVSCIPYWGAIPGGVRPGLVIHIKGYVTKDSVEFAINLMHGNTAPTSNTNIALHVNPRVRDQYIVFNSRNQNGWGVEESYCGQFITSGNTFILDICVESNLYNIYVNGVHIKSFHHRLAYQDVGVLWIEKGNVDIRHIEYRERAVYSPPVYKPAPLV